MRILKILNPIIFILNFICWSATAQHWAEMQKSAKDKGREFKRPQYDYSRDIRYF